MFFGVPEINVFGHIISGQEIRPDNKKIEAVVNAPKPKCASEVRSFLGRTNYCSRYVPDYSTIICRLGQLAKSNRSFQWRQEQEDSFNKPKQALASPPVLAYYSLTAPTRLVVHASPWALGAVLQSTTANRFFLPTDRVWKWFPK